jgi:hypothetical protein
VVVEARPRSDANDGAAFKREITMSKNASGFVGNALKVIVAASIASLLGGCAGELAGDDGRVDVSTSSDVKPSALLAGSDPNGGTYGGASGGIYCMSGSLCSAPSSTSRTPASAPPSPSAPAPAPTPSASGSSSVDVVYNGNDTITYSSTGVSSCIMYWSSLPPGIPMMISSSQMVPVTANATGTVSTIHGMYYTMSCTPAPGASWISKSVQAS